jgi:hypothetical protein
MKNRWNAIQRAMSTVAFLLFSCSIMADGGTNNDACNPALLIAQLRERVTTRDPTAWTLVVETVDALSACGEPAIPILLGALQGEPDGDMAALLARAVAQIPGEKSSRALVALYRTTPTLRDSILAGICKGRAEKNGTMGFTLSDEEVRVFQSAIETSHPVEIRGIAEVLSICRDSDVSAALDAMVRRFVEQVEHPIPPMRTLSYVPPQICELGHFAMGFHFLGKAAIPALMRERRKRGSADIDKWLVIALGNAGDMAVAERTKDIMLHDPDKYIRGEAIRAYARSAKSEAIPLLETFKDDTTTSEYSDHQFYLLRNEAASALHELKSP